MTGTPPPSTRWWRVLRANSTPTSKSWRSFTHTSDVFVIFRLKAEEAAQLADHNLNLFRRKQQDLEEMETRLREGNEVLQKLQKK